jgi:hypothetical protein
MPICDTASMIFATSPYPQAADNSSADTIKRIERFSVKRKHGMDKFLPGTGGIGFLRIEMGIWIPPIELTKPALS